MTEQLSHLWSPPVSSVHGIFQERILEWVAISFWAIREALKLPIFHFYSWRVFSPTYRILVFRYFLWGCQSIKTFIVSGKKCGVNLIIASLKFILFFWLLSRFSFLFYGYLLAFSSFIMIYLVILYRIIMLDICRAPWKWSLVIFIISLFGEKILNPSLSKYCYAFNSLLPFGTSITCMLDLFY